MFAKMAGLTSGESLERFIAQALPFHVPSSGPTRWRHIKHMYAGCKSGFIDNKDIALLYPVTPADKSEADHAPASRPCGCGTCASMRVQPESLKRAHGRGGISPVPGGLRSRSTLSNFVT